MADRKDRKTLWGNEFRVVRHGLAETDVVVFVERLTRDLQATTEKLAYLDSLRESARNAVEDSERLAQSIKDDAGEEAREEYERVLKASRAEAARVLEQAEDLAKARLELAERKLNSLREDSLRDVRSRVSRLESALEQWKKAALRELTTEMRSHYVAKHLYDSPKFLAAFNQLISEVEAITGRSEGKS